MNNIIRHSLLMIDQETLLRYVFFSMTIFISMRFAIQLPDIITIWTDVFTIMRRVVILLFSKLIMSNIVVAKLTYNSDTFGNIHITETMSIMCVNIVLLTALIQIINPVTNSRSSNELDKLLYSLQTIFADMFVDIINDPDVLKIITFIGFVLPSILSYMMNFPRNNIFGILFGALGMAWVNILVTVIVPTSQWSSSTIINAGTALALAAILYAFTPIFPGLRVLQGYFEWNISNIIIEETSNDGMTAVETILVSSIVLVISNFLNTLSKHTDTKISALDTISNIMTIVILSTTASICMQTMSRISYITENMMVSIVIIILAQMAHRLMVLYKLIK
jgi:hypothetical protein